MIKNRTDNDYLRIYPKIIDKLKYSLIDWDLADVRKASKGGAKLGAFILASCLIDHLTCYYFGQESSRNDYIEFARRFLPQYNAEDLYFCIRCKLVHNYSVDGNYAFTHNKHRLHLRKEDGKIILNLNDFVKDIESATKNYFLAVDNSDTLKINLAKRYIDAGIMSPVEISNA